MADVTCPPNPRVGVVGVGAMGMGIARALLARGFEVIARDIVPEREAEAVRAGAKTGSEVDILMTVVVDAEQTRDVLFGSRPVRAPLVMMCSTISPSDTEEIAKRLAPVALVDSPISGGPSRAHAGTLSVMASGGDAAIERCKPVLEAISAKWFRISDRPGDGSRMKVVNNMLAAANLAAGCEAMAMASKLGLDLRQVADVVNASSGQSWIFADRMERALAGDYAPRAAARVLRKDVSLFVDAARALGVDAPLARAAQQVFEDTVARGFGEEDDAAVLKRYRDTWSS
jgi:3-hydroxyisobutyrate dehydrogenase-like beta-hydroxyacid dehydrogenase